MRLVSGTTSYSCRGVLVTTPRGEHVTCKQAEKVAILEYFVMRKSKNFHFGTNPFFLVISPTFWFLEENRGSLRQ